MPVVIPNVDTIWLTPEGDVVVEYTGQDRVEQRDSIVAALEREGIRCEVPPEGVPWWEECAIKLLSEGRMVALELEGKFHVYGLEGEETEEEYRRRVKSPTRYRSGTFPHPIVGRKRRGLMVIPITPSKDLLVIVTPNELKLKTKE
jgi:hypothetical protein